MGLLSLVAVSSFFRFYGLADSPYGVEVDGGTLMKSVHDFLYEKKVVDHLFSVACQPLIYLMRLAMFKATSQVSREDLFLLSAIIGTATVLAMFILMQKILTSRIIALSAILLATSVWHITFSRYAFAEIAFQPLIAVISLYLIYKIGYEINYKKYLYLFSLLISICPFIGYHTFLILPFIFLFYIGCIRKNIFFSSYIYKAFFISLIFYCVQCLIYAYLLNIENIFIFPETFYNVWVVNRKGFGYIEMGIPQFINTVFNNLNEFKTIFWTGIIGEQDWRPVFAVFETSGSNLEKYLIIPSATLGLIVAIKCKNNFYKLLIIFIIFQCLFYLILNRPTRRYWLIASPLLIILSAIGIDVIFKGIESCFAIKRRVISTILIVATISISPVITYYEYFIRFNKNDYHLWTVFNGEGIYKFIISGNHQNDFLFISRLDYIKNQLDFYSHLSLDTSKIQSLDLYQEERVNLAADLKKFRSLLNFDSKNVVFIVEYPIPKGFLNQLKGFSFNELEKIYTPSGSISHIAYKLN